MKPLIAVIGAGQCDDRINKIAYEVGKNIAINDFGMVCGGLGGVMEAAAHGCRDAGGLTVGIIPQENADTANKYIDIIIPTGMGIMRNLLVIRSAMGVIAVDGKYGTLSEIAFALQLQKPIVGIETWDVSKSLLQVQTPEEAVNQIITRIKL
jgi:uncharacterized protein (TIGR00725 family)